MKKRILSILLSLCMVLTLMPAATITASAADPATVNELWVGDTQVVQSGGTVTTTTSGTGWSYDSATTTLTLDGANITTIAHDSITDNYGLYYYGIYCYGDLNIVAEGDSTIDARAADFRSYGIFIRGNLSVSGSGELTTTGNWFGLGIKGDLAVSGSVDLSGIADKTGSSGSNTNLTGVMVSVKESYGDGTGNITVSDTASLTGHAYAELYNYGMQCLSGNINVGSGAILTAIADEYSGTSTGSESYGLNAGYVNAPHGQVSIEGTLVASAGDAGDHGYADGLSLYNTDLVVSGSGSVSAESGESPNTTATSYGVQASGDTEIIVNGGGFLASGGTGAVKPATTSITITGTPVRYEISANMDGSGATVCTDTDTWNATYNGNFGAYKYINATTVYEVYINGTQVTRVNSHDVLGDGTVSYAPASGSSPARLTLNGADLSQIKLDGNTELVLTGDNVIGNVETAGNLDLGGTGGLSVTGKLDCGSSQITVASGAALTLQGTLAAGSIINGGALNNSSNDTITIATLTNNGTLNNSGIMNVTGSFDGDGNTTNGGTLTLPNGTVEETAIGISGEGLTEVKGADVDSSIFYTNGTKLKAIMHALDFTEAAAYGGWNESAALENDGYIWDGEAKKLTLKNIMVQGADLAGITVPNGTVVVLEGISIVTSDDDEAIEGNGTLTVQGNGSLRASGPDGGFSGGKISITDKVRVVVNGITTDMDEEGSEVSVSGNAVLTSTKEISTENYTQTGNASVKVSGISMPSGIMARGDMRIDGGSLDVSSKNVALMAIGAIKLGSGMAVLTPQGGKIASASTTVSGVNYSVSSVISADQTSLSVEVDEATKSISTNGAKHIIIGAAPAASGGGGGHSAGAGSEAISLTDDQLKEITEGSAGNPNFRIDVSDLKSNSVVIPSKIVSEVNGSSDKKGLSVIMPAGTVTLDKTALAAVSGKGDVKLSVETVDNEKLTDTQKEVLGTQADSAVVVDVNIYVNGIKTSTFGDGKLSISVPYTLKSGENADSITVWFIKDDGAIEPKNGTYNAVTGCVEFTTDHLSQYLIVKFPFADVAESAWYYDSVAYACNNGLFSGTSETSFSPGAAMTRQMIWMVLARMDGKSPANMTEAKAWAVENKISDGSNPKNSITRGQMAAILYRYAQYKSYDTTQGGMAIREFADYNSIPAYALEALGWTVNTGLMQGSGDNLMPQGNATRAQVAAILQRFSQNVAK